MSKFKINQTPFYDNEKIAVFIDGANLYAASRALDFDIDYRLLLEWLAAQSQLVRAYYYTALIEDQEYSPVKPLVDWLDYNGYTMVTKTVREFTDEQGRKKVKGNMDVELAVDMMEMADHIDHAILFSGDGGFAKLIEAVQRKGTRVTVISTIQSSSSMVADELRRKADHFIDLEMIADQIMRDGDLSYDEDELEPQKATAA